MCVLPPCLLCVHTKRCKQADNMTAAHRSLTFTTAFLEIDSNYAISGTGSCTAVLCFVSSADELVNGPCSGATKPVDLPNLGICGASHEFTHRSTYGNYIMTENYTHLAQRDEKHSESCD